MTSPIKSAYEPKQKTLIGVDEVFNTTIKDQTAATPNQFSPEWNKEARKIVANWDESKDGKRPTLMDPRRMNDETNLGALARKINLHHKALDEIRRERNLLLRRKTNIDKQKELLDELLKNAERVKELVLLPITQVLCHVLRFLVVRLTIPF